MIRLVAERGVAQGEATPRPYMGGTPVPHARPRRLLYAASQIQLGRGDRVVTSARVRRVQRH